MAIHPSTNRARRYFVDRGQRATTKPSRVCELLPIAADTDTDIY